MQQQACEAQKLRRCHLSPKWWSFLEFTGAFFRELQAYFCLESSLAHMLCISSQPQHMDPVTLTEPLLLWEGFSYPKWKNSLHFFSALFEQNMTLKREENTARLKSFHTQMWPVSIFGPRREVRNENYKGSPGFTRSHAHIYHHRDFLKKRYPFRRLTFCTHGKDSDFSF